MFSRVNKKVIREVYKGDIDTLKTIENKYETE